MLTKPLIDLLNKIDEPWKIVLHVVPMRIIRVTTPDFKTFRVEQLSLTNKDKSNPRGEWRTLSSHSGTSEGESMMIAWKAAVDAAAKLRHQVENRMGNIRRTIQVPA